MPVPPLSAGLVPLIAFVSAALAISHLEVGKPTPAAISSIALEPLSSITILSILTHPPILYSVSEAFDRFLEDAILVFPAL